MYGMAQNVFIQLRYYYYYYYYNLGGMRLESLAIAAANDLFC
jgi:hypothetical protein